MGIAEYPRYMEVLEHYGLFRNPFGEALEPYLFYPATSHVKVLASLTDGIAKGFSVQVVSSMPGVGKTTVLQLLFDRLDKSEVIFHRQPRLRAWESLKYFLLKLGITTEEKSVEVLQGRLVEALRSKQKVGSSITLIVDEAQNLGKEMLAILHSLSADQLGAGYVNLVLATQGSSAAALGELGRNTERFSILELKPLHPEEVGYYISHRLRVSGCNQQIFTREAVRRIAEYSRGIPREINTVCSEALRLCIEPEGSRTIDEYCLRQAIPFPSSSYRAYAIEETRLDKPPPMEPDQRGALEPKILLEELERWFKHHDHSWSGTRSELLAELPPQTGISDFSEHLDALLNVLEENAPALATSGMGVSIKPGAGGPLLITLQHIDPQARAEDATETAADRDPRDSEKRLSTTESSQQPPRPQDTVSARSVEPGDSVDASREKITDDRTDALRRALRHSDTDGENVPADHPRRNTWLWIMLILIVLTVTLLWVGRTFIIGRTQNGGRGALATIDSGDDVSFFRKLLRSAESGDSASQLALAKMYLSGDRIEKNDTEAARWLREAAAHGEAEASYRLANAYLSGEGVPANKVDAYCWYVLAAEAGNDQSEQEIKALTAQLSDREIATVRYQLGQMHLRGTGTQPDKVAAYFWFRLAEVAGHPAAKRAEQALASEMSEEEMTTAAAKAAKWLQVHPPRSAPATLENLAGNQKCMRP